MSAPSQAALGKAGDAFMLPRGKEGIPHLHAVVIASDAATGQCIVVNFTTKRRGVEQTLVVDAGAHPFIQHESCALFSDAKIVEISKLRAAEQSGLVKRQPRFRPEVLRQIEKALLRSSFTPQMVKEKYHAWSRLS